MAIVRALAMKPDLLLLDEVTSALDPELVAEVLDVIRELAAGGMTMVIATHEMAFARDVANRVCFLDAGSILEEGPPARIFGEPREERTRQFLQRIRARDGGSVDALRLAVSPPAPATRAAGYALSVEHTKRIDVSLEPLDQYIVVQPVSDETETRSGLILPASAASTAACRTGIVTAVGADANGVEAGDKVLYPGEAGYDVRLGGIEVKVLKREDLIARVHD